MKLIKSSLFMADIHDISFNKVIGYLDILRQTINSEYIMITDDNKEKDDIEPKRLLDFSLNNKDKEKNLFFRNYMQRKDSTETTFNNFINEISTVDESSTVDGSSLGLSSIDDDNSTELEDISWLLIWLERFLL